MACLYNQALLTRAADAAGGADAATLMGVDAGRVVNLVPSFQELWSLPVQLAVAMWLLYAQVGRGGRAAGRFVWRGRLQLVQVEERRVSSRACVKCAVHHPSNHYPPTPIRPTNQPPQKVRFAFVAGVALCLAMLPVNRALAGRIQAASLSMMAHKDSRVRLMGELLRGVRVVKVLSWEPAFVRRVGAARGLELQQLAVGFCLGWLLGVLVGSGGWGWCQTRCSRSCCLNSRHPS
jgi:hypothetical protein